MPNKPQTFRFAAGTQDNPASGVWRVVVQGREVYLGTSKRGMGMLKLSMHSSGVWALAFTKKAKGKHFNGNRRGRSWRRPPEHAPGVTRGPSVFVPHATVGTRRFPPNEFQKPIRWYPPPSPGHEVEFSLYFVREDAVTNWDADCEEIGVLHFAAGGRLVVLARCRRMSPENVAATEKFLSDHVFTFSDLQKAWPYNTLSVMDSPDALKVPVILDLPIVVREAQLGKPEKPSAAQG